MELWYEAPYQVRFWWQGAYQQGIVFHEYIVGAKDGVFYPTKMILEKAKESGVSEDDAVIEYGDWRDLSSEF